MQFYKYVQGNLWFLLITYSRMSWCSSYHKYYSNLVNLGQGIQHQDQTCEKICKKTDVEGTTWEECVGLAIRNCSGQTEGQMYWFCMGNGNFFGPNPHFGNCTTKWIAKIRQDSEGDEILEYDEAYELLNTINTMVLSGRNLSDLENEGKYYGHEIDDIFELGHAVLMRTELTPFKSFEAITDLLISIYNHVYLNYNVWIQLPRHDCTKLGTDFVGLIEHRLLSLSGKVMSKWRRDALSNSDQISYSNSSFTTGTENVYMKSYDQCAFKPFVGVKLRNHDGDAESRLEKISFPPNASRETDSYLELPLNWLDYMDYEDVGDFITGPGIEFVGIELSSQSANYLFPADESLYGYDQEFDIGDGYFDIGNFSLVDDQEFVDKPAETKTINGKVLSFTFGKNAETKSINFTGAGVIISFQHSVPTSNIETRRPLRRRLHPGEVRKAMSTSATCVFWHVDSMSWSTEGCHLVTSGPDKTICECFHLTSFAVLMDLHNYNGRDFGLEILTWISVPPSILCLAFTIVILSISKSLSNPRSIITRHLSFCLLVGFTLTLTLMDKHYILTGDTFCTITGATIHYFLLVAFMWMGFEGILLYRMVILVFESGRDYMRYQVLTAYAVPLLIVAVTLMSTEFNGSAYVGNEFCWLQGSFIWTFLGPVSMILIFNFGVLLITLRTAYSLPERAKGNKSTKKSKRSKYITLIRGSFSVNILLGTTWIFGYLMLIDNYSVANMAAYIFTLLNASQGILLFCFHCLWNTKVREALIMKFSYLPHSNNSSSSLTPSNYKMRQVDIGSSIGSVESSSSSAET